MPVGRYYIDQLTGSGSHVVEGVEFHHLCHVMRARVGESVEAVDGKGALAHGEIVEMRRSSARIEIKDLHIEERPKLKVAVAQALPKMNRLENVAEKGTELGMTHLRIFRSAHGEKKDLNSAQLERLKGVAIAALKQCGRLYLPQILFYSSLESWLESEELPLFFGDVSETARPLILAIEEGNLADGIAIAIGPESGFTQNEISSMQRAGAKGVKLHRNILRTDTASLAALALIEQKLSLK